jgi:hypothetical protein
LLLAVSACGGTLPTLKVEPPRPIPLRFVGRGSTDGELTVAAGAPAARSFVPFSEDEVRQKLGGALHGRTVTLPDGSDVSLTTFREQLNAYERFLSQLGVSLRDADGGEPVLLALRPRTPINSESSTGRFGDIGHPTNTEAGPGCFLEGRVDSGWLDAQRCFEGDLGNDGWFGVDACAEFASLILWNQRERFMILQMWQNVTERAVLFGARVNAAKVHADLAWQKNIGEKGLGPLKARSLGLRGQTLVVGEDTQKVWGPPVDVMAGPVTMRLFPRLTVHGEAGRVETQLDHFPEKCDQEGTLKLQSWPQMKIAVDSESGALPFVKYKLEGDLVLSDDTWGIESVFRMEPTNNSFSHAPTARGTYRHHEGSLYLVVDADFLVGHKRWRILIEKSPGAHGTIELGYPPHVYRTR